MIGLGIRVTGLGELDGWLKAYQAEIGKQTRSAMRKAGQVIVRAEKANVGRPASAKSRAANPTRDPHPGQLYRSIRNGRVRLLGSGVYSMSVGPSPRVIYRSVQEGRHPYVRPAIDSHGGEAYAAFFAEATRGR